jgi:hypothetical protein
VHPGQVGRSAARHGRHSTRLKLLGASLGFESEHLGDDPVQNSPAGRSDPAEKGATQVTSAPAAESVRRLTAVRVELGTVVRPVGSFVRGASANKTLTSRSRTHTALADGRRTLR